MLSDAERELAGQFAQLMNAVGDEAIRPSVKDAFEQLRQLLGGGSSYPVSSIE